MEDHLINGLQSKLYITTTWGLKKKVPRPRVRDLTFPLSRSSGDPHQSSRAVLCKCIPFYSDENAMYLCRPMWQQLATCGFKALKMWLVLPRTWIVFNFINRKSWLVAAMLDNAGREQAILSLIRNLSFIV